jgi:hypothetical protein
LDVGQVVTDHIVERHDERDGDFQIHPSAESTCPRQGIYSARGVPRTDATDPRSKRIMFLGTAIHELVQGALLEADPDAQDEVDIGVDGLPLSGSADLIMDTPAGEVVYEFKSISPAGFRYVQDEPKPEHSKQIKWYMYGRELQGYPPADHGVIVYFDRNDLRSVQHVVHLEDEDRTRMRRVLDEAPQYLDPESTLLPERPPETRTKRGFWLCDYCPWRTRCFTQDTNTRRID